MSLSNKCMPPLGSPSTLNVGTSGVGIGCPPLLCFRAPVMENVWLNGVPMETSEPSGLEIDRVRCFRLRDDLFFRIPIAGCFPFFGEPGTRPVSFERPWLMAGVAGDTVVTVSAGL